MNKRVLTRQRVTVVRQVGRRHSPLNHQRPIPRRYLGSYHLRFPCSVIPQIHSFPKRAIAQRGDLVLFVSYDEGKQR